MRTRFPSRSAGTRPALLWRVHEWQGPRRRRRHAGRYGLALRGHARDVRRDSRLGPRCGDDVEGRRADRGRLASTAPLPRWTSSWGRWTSHARSSAFAHAVKLARPWVVRGGGLDLVHSNRCARVGPPPRRPRARGVHVAPRGGVDYASPAQRGHAASWWLASLRRRVPSSPCTRCDASRRQAILVAARSYCADRVARCHGPETTRPTAPARETSEARAAP